MKATGWDAHARQAIIWLAVHQRHLTTDDVFERLESQGITTNRDTRILGSLMRDAHMARIIEWTDETVESRRGACHRRPKRVWRSMVVGQSLLVKDF